jgi:hypothetical protein
MTRVTEVLSIFKEEIPGYLQSRFDQAGEFGRKAHECFRLINQGKKFELENADPILESFVNDYDIWFKDNVAEVFAVDTIEARIEDIELDFGGLPDAIVKLKKGKRKVILDYKTGQKSRLWFLQLGGYGVLTGNVCEGRILHFRKDIGRLNEVIEISYVEMVRYGQLFLKALDLYNYLKE